jgi:hypothetical protein
MAHGSFGFCRGHSGLVGKLSVFSRWKRREGVSEVSRRHEAGSDRTHRHRDRSYAYRLHAVQPDQPNSAGQEQEEFHIGNLVYQRKLDDSWAARPTRTVTPNAVCQTLAQGTDSKLFPDLATMIQRGIIEKGDKKMVNDVRCREWKVTLKEPKGLEHLTVCLGLDDHLPYEMTMDWQHARATYYDYNATFQLDLPGAARPAGEISATN